MLQCTCCSYDFCFYICFLPRCPLALFHAIANAAALIQRGALCPRADRAVNLTLEVCAFFAIFYIHTDITFAHCILLHATLHAGSDNFFHNISINARTYFGNYDMTFVVVIICLWLS